jgi:hypothetical protein
LKLEARRKEKKRREGRKIRRISVRTVDPD